MIQWLQIMKLWLILLNILVTLMQFTNYLYRMKLDSFSHPVFYVTWDDMPAVVGVWVESKSVIYVWNNIDIKTRELSW